MAARSARRASGRHLGRRLVPGVVILGLWLADRDPGGTAGFAGACAVGLITGLLWPLAALFLLQAPGSLVPPRLRMWYRRGEEDRPHIPDWLRRVVYAADRHACAYCTSSYQLQLDHIRPWSFGGRTSFWNFMTLCGQCNRMKSNYWQFRDGRAYYAPYGGHGNVRRAQAILAFERSHRWSPARIIRAALAL